MINGKEKKFWAEAVNTAAYIINRTGKSSVKNKTPYEVWCGKKVNFEIFQDFGLRVSVHIPKEKRLKWDPKNKIGVFTGYCDETKGFRIFFEEENKVEFHRDVIFLPEKAQDQENESREEECIVLSENREEESETEEEISAENEGNSNSDISQLEQVPGEIPRYNLRENRRPPRRLEDYELYMDDTLLACILDEDDPVSYDEAMSSENKAKWTEAIESEIKALEENDTWIVEKNPNNAEVIDSKWVFKGKKDEAGNISRFKARLVARGFKQSECISDIYSPVAKLPSVRFFFSVCNYLKIPIYQMDVCSAFLNGDC